MGATSLAGRFSRKALTAAVAAVAVMLAVTLLPGGARGSEAAAPGKAVQDSDLTVSLPYYSLAIPEGSLGHFELCYADGPLPSALGEGGDHAAWAEDAFRGYRQAKFASNETHGLSVIFDHAEGAYPVADFEVFCYAGEASSGADGSAAWADAGALSADGLRIGVRVRVAEADGDGTASGLRARLDEAIDLAAEYASWVGQAGAQPGGDGAVVGLSLAADEGAPGGISAHLATPYYEFDLLADVTQHGVGFTYDENGTKPDEGTQERWGYFSHIMGVAYGAYGAEYGWADSIDVDCRTEQDYPWDGPWAFLELEDAVTSADGLHIQIGVPYAFVPGLERDSDVDDDALVQGALDRAHAIAATVEVK